MLAGGTIPTDGRVVGVMFAGGAGGLFVRKKIKTKSLLSAVISDLYNFCMCLCVF